MRNRSDRAEDLKEVGKSAVTTVLDRVGRGVGKVQERTPLPYDLLESDDAYLIVFDAPGATRSDVRVRFRGNAVEVRLDRFRDTHEGFEMRFPGRGLALDGRVELPVDASVDPSAAEATLTDGGTLHVRLPKTEATKGTTVAVTEEKADSRGDVGVNAESDADGGNDVAANSDREGEDEDWERPVGEAVGMGDVEGEDEPVEKPESDENGEWEKPVGEAVSMGDAEDEDETVDESDESEEPAEYDSPEEYEESREEDSETANTDDEE